MIDRQKVFNHAWYGIKAQRFNRSMMPGSEDACAYRGRNGYKCFVGHNIPNSRYKNSLEGRSIRAYQVIDMLDPNLGYPASEDDIAFLRNGQLIHDSTAVPEDMERKLRKFAVDYGLEVPS